MSLIACRSRMTFLLFSLGLAATDATSAAMEQRNLVELRAVAAGPPAEQGESTENRITFATGEEAGHLSRNMQQRLADPELRATLRSEQRASIQEQYAKAGQVLGLDPATEHKLIELLTDQQLGHLERMYSVPRPTFDSYEQAQVTTQQLEALHELLGEEGLDRFQAYKARLSERRQVELLAARFAPGNELQPDQEERLIALLHEQTLRDIALARGPGRMLLSFQRGGKLPSGEEMQRESELHTIAINEETWRRRQVTNRNIEKQATAFLTPVQLRELSKLQARDQDNLRQWIQSARVRAGLSPEIPQHAAISDDPAVSRKPVAGQVRVEIRMTIDRGEPTVVTQTVRNGESFTFAAANGLMADATPTLYDDHWLNVQIDYYEQRAAGKYPLEGGGTLGVLTRAPDGTPTSGGGGSTVIAGRKAYVIETMIGATAQ